MIARDEILQRVRDALADLESSPEIPVDDEGFTSQDAKGLPTRDDEESDVLGLFAERCEDYRAAVHRVLHRDLPSTIARVLVESGVESVVLPSGLDPTWRQEIAQTRIRVVDDDPPLSHGELNDVSAVVTAAKVGIAETGTIVLDHGPDQGRRALSLVPDLHLCVINEDQIVADVPDALPRLRPSIESGRPLTWISGPSATSDIELERVEGVHGPRTLIVILASQ